MTVKIGRTFRIASITEPRSVSARTRISSLAIPNRRARILICAADSSPDTYRTVPFVASAADACMRSELFPMPGSPPSSTHDPCTIPPPSTRSNSPMPVTIRSSASAGTSPSAIGARGARARPRPFGAATIRSSTSVFHPSHDGHRPTHFGDWKPHCWQMKADFG